MRRFAAAAIDAPALGPFPERPVGGRREARTISDLKIETYTLPGGVMIPGNLRSLAFRMTPRTPIVSGPGCFAVARPAPSSIDFIPLRPPTIGR